MNRLIHSIRLIWKVHVDFVRQINVFGLRFAFYGYVWWINFYFRTPVAWKISSWAMRKKTAWLDDYLQSKYAETFTSFLEAKHCTNPMEPSRQIWVFWGQGEHEMPELVSACYRQLRKNNPEAILLTLENYKKYVDLPEEIVEKVRKGSLSWAVFSDILRTALLAIHGGLWLDATVWVSQRIPWDKIEKHAFFSANGQISKGGNSMCFWTSMECNWSSWCMYAHQKGYALFLFASSLLKAIALGEKQYPDYVLQDYAIYTAYRLIPQVRQDMARLTELPCPNRNKLAEWMNLPYNEREYKRLTESDFVFKLSFRSPWYPFTSSGQETFYGHLISSHGI